MTRRGTRSDEPRMRSHWKLLRRIAPYLKPHKRLAGASVTLMVLSAAVALAAPWPLAFLIDGVLGGADGGSSHLPGWITSLFGTSPRKLVVVAALAGLLLALVIHGLAVLDDYVNTTLSQRMILRFRSDLVDNALRQSVAFHDSRSMGDFIARINYESSSVGAITVGLPPLVQSLLTLTGMAVISYRIDHVLALLALGVVPIIYYSTGYYGRKIEPRLRHARGLEGRSLGIVYEAMSMLRVIAAFNRERHEHRRFHEQAAESVECRIGVTVRQSVFSLVVHLTTAAGTALVLGVGAMHVLDGKLSVGQLLVLLAYIEAVYGPLQTVSHSMATFQEQFIYLAMSLELLDAKPAIDDAPDAVDLPPAKGAVEFDDVSFAYAGRSQTLDHITFRVEPGEAVAIVGATGAGKTTLMSMLSRLCDPDEGAVRIDGHDLRNVTLRSLREQVSVVLQEPKLFTGTVADNIGYGRLGATMDEIVAAAVAANANDFILGLPHQYDTLLGENGTALSGGERQRICVARAFLKDAPILVLDEPTSSIDSKTEGAILDALEKLMDGRTTFMIAHRLSTLRSVDRILVLDHGRLVEQGAHHELLAADGWYRALHDIQQHDRQRFHDDEDASELVDLEPHATLHASPNPVTAESGTDVGRTTLRWLVRGCSATEVRIDAPNGPVFAAAEHDPAAETEHIRETGAWVSDGMTFYLQDRSDGRPPTSAHTLATVVARVEPAWHERLHDDHDEHDEAWVIAR